MTLSNCVLLGKKVPQVARIVSLTYLWIILLKASIDVVLLIVHMSLNGTGTDYKYLVAIHLLILFLISYLALLLYLSIRSTNYRNLKCWLGTSAVVVVLELLTLGFEIYSEAAFSGNGNGKEEDQKRDNLERLLRSPWENFPNKRQPALDIAFDVVDFLEILFHIYALVIVYKYMEEIKPDKKEEFLPPTLTEAPIGDGVVPAPVTEKESMPKHKHEHEPKPDTKGASISSLSPPGSGTKLLNVKFENEVST